jgi:hypothetical protein
MTIFRMETIAERELPVTSGRLFGCLSNLSDYAAWLPEAVSVRMLAPNEVHASELVLGTRLQLTSHGVSMELEVVEFAPPHTIGFRVRTENSQALETWTVDPLPGNRCRLMVTLELEDADHGQQLVEFLSGSLDIHRARVAVAIDGMVRLLTSIRTDQ